MARLQQLFYPAFIFSAIFAFAHPVEAKTENREKPAYKGKVSAVASARIIKPVIVNFSQDTKTDAPQLQADIKTDVTCQKAKDRSDGSSTRCRRTTIIELY